MRGIEKRPPIGPADRRSLRKSCFRDGAWPDGQQLRGRRRDSVGKGTSEEGAGGDAGRSREKGGYLEMLQEAGARLQVEGEATGKQETNRGKKEITEGTGAWRPWEGGGSSRQKEWPC